MVKITNQAPPRHDTTAKRTTPTSNLLEINTLTVAWVITINGQPGEKNPPDR